MDEVKLFHKSRIAFMIINDEVLYLVNSTKSHIEWFETLNLNSLDFNEIVRGYVRENLIVFYKGDFEYDEKVYEHADWFSNKIIDDLGVDNPLIYVGVKKGDIGEIWEPMNRIELSKNKNRYRKR